MSTNTMDTDGEMNLVEAWVRKDPVRWIAGAITGVIAMGIALGVGMIIATLNGMEIWFPVKIIATILLGSSATEYGLNVPSILAGFCVTGALGAFWGLVYSHFTFTNRPAGLFGMGLTWGVFLWIFHWCLYLQSFPTIRAARLSPGAVFPICIAYGVSLMLVGIIDPIIRGSRK